jgi:DNA replication protein DnaC
MNIERLGAWARSGIPVRHRDEVFGSGEWNDWLGKLGDMVGSGFLMALLGDRGTGKTQMGAELVRYWIRIQTEALASAHAPRYVKAMEIFMAIKSSYGGGGREKDVISTFTGPKLLIIDEASERGETDWENRMMTYIIDKRYDAKLDTLLISNQRRDAFLESVGDSITSRLVETGGIITCNWESFRKAAT